MRTQVGAYHDLERRQYDALLKVPPQLEYERKAAAASNAMTRHVVSGGAAGAGLASSGAFRDLLAGVAAAQAGTKASLKQAGLEFVASEIRNMWRLFFNKWTASHVGK
jgi:hypothetical protein